MKPDLWPNGVPITEGWEIRANTAIFNETNGIGESSGWKLLVCPTKYATAASIVSSKNEYLFYGNEDLTYFIRTSNLAEEASNAGGIMCSAPTWARYLVKSIRGSNTVSSLTFYYNGFPESSWEPNTYYRAIVKRNYEISGSTGLTYSSTATYSCMFDYGYCKDATLITFYKPNQRRGAMCFYDEDKKFLSRKAYGQEFATFQVPDGACFFRWTGYTSNSSTQRGITDHYDVITLTIE